MRRTTGDELQRPRAGPVGQHLAPDPDPLPRAGSAPGDRAAGGRRSARPWTCATAASVGTPPSIRRAGAGACSTTPGQARQASFGRLVTSTRNCAGITSSRSASSTPISTSGPWQQGQAVASGASTSSMRGRCAGNRLHSRYERRLLDLPSHGRAVELLLQLRRLRCLAAGCPRQTFAEPLPLEVARRSGRRTARLDGLVGISAWRWRPPCRRLGAAADAAGWQGHVAARPPSSGAGGGWPHTRPRH